MNDLGHDFTPPPRDDRWRCHEIVDIAEDLRPIYCGRSLREHVDLTVTIFPLEAPDAS